MISVDEATAIIHQYVCDFGTEEIELNQGIGRIIRENIAADRDLPPYDRVTMDGIAIRFEDYAAGKRDFPIRGIAAAGAARIGLEEDGCLEVMTGAIMPESVDTVIPYEKIEINDNIATLLTEDVVKQQNIHFKGEDRTEGEVVIQSGVQLSAVEIGVCAAVGKHRVKVSKLPRAIVISSGDELIEIHETPDTHQIRQSNVYKLKTVLEHYHARVDTAHILDDYDTIVEKLKSYLSQYDLVVLSGGVSKGKFDFLPRALDEVGVEKHFHRIAQRPGKPFWFGTYGDAVTVFAFPGNPVSSFMCMQNYFKPWLEKSLQMQPHPQPMARLTQDVVFKPDLTYFLEVKLDFDAEGRLLANPIKGNGSGDLANLVDADAFIKLPRGRDEFKVGEVFPIVRYRSMTF